MRYVLCLILSSFFYYVHPQEQVICTGTIASIGTILSGDPPTLRNILQFDTTPHATTCLQLQMPDGSNRRNVSVTIGTANIASRLDVPRMVAPSSVPTLYCDDGCGDGYVPNNLYNWRDTQCLNYPNATYAQAAPRIVDHNDCNHNFFTGAGSPNYGYTGICLQGKEEIHQVIDMNGPTVEFTVDGPDFSCYGHVVNDLPAPCTVNTTIQISATASTTANNIMNRWASFDRKCLLPTYLNPSKGCSVPSGQMWFSVLNNDEATQCLLTLLNQQNWAGDPHCLNVANDAASHAAIWNWQDCTPNGGDNVGLSLSYFPLTNNIINDDKHAKVSVKLDIRSFIAYVDYAIKKCTLISGTGNVQEASAAVSVIVLVQETSLHQCGCRTADDEIINLSCVSGYCVSDLPLSNYTTTTLCSLNCITLNLTIHQWNTTHTQYGEVVATVHDAPPGGNGGLGGFFDSIGNTVIGMLFEFGHIWDIGSCGLNIGCLLKSIFGSILSLLVFGLIGGLLYKFVIKKILAWRKSSGQVEVLVRNQTEMAQRA